MLISISNLKICIYFNNSKFTSQRIKQSKHKNIYHKQPTCLLFCIMQVLKLWPKYFLAMFTPIFHESFLLSHTSVESWVTFCSCYIPMKVYYDIFGRFFSVCLSLCFRSSYLHTTPAWNQSPNNRNVQKNWVLKSKEKLPWVKLQTQRPQKQEPKQKRHKDGGALK